MRKSLASVQDELDYISQVMTFFSEVVFVQSVQHGDDITDFSLEAWAGFYYLTDHLLDRIKAAREQCEEGLKNQLKHA